MFKVKGSTPKNSNYFSANAPKGASTTGRDLGLPRSANGVPGHFGGGSRGPKTNWSGYENNAKNDANGSGKKVATKAQQKSGSAKTFGK